MPQVFNQGGQGYALGEKIGGGAQGEVFSLPALPDRVVKIFLPPFRTGEEGKRLRGKLAALRDKQLAGPLPEVAWPEFSVFDGEGQWHGYVMRRLPGVSLADQILSPRRLLEEWRGSDRRLLAATAAAFLETLRRLHQADVWVGDFNPGNFLFAPRQGRIAFIDVDSYQVAAGASRYGCALTTPGMMPPEHFNVRIARQWRSPESELFSGALVVFLLLMPGKHPFDAKGTENHQAGILTGSFPYRPRGEPPTGRIPAGPWETVWNDFPLSLQRAFTEIFVRGHRVPKARGTLERLLAAVREYHACLSRGEGMLAIDFRRRGGTRKRPRAAPRPSARPAAARRPPPVPVPPPRITRLAEPSLWQEAKPRSFWGRVLWWLVG